MGGPSSEREISLKSGAAVLGALEKEGFEAVSVDITTDDRGQNIRLIESYNLDCAFLALHGYFGEDGAVQEILDNLGVPYTCSGVAASRLAMDKAASRRIFSRWGLKVPRDKILAKENAASPAELSRDLGLPLVVKPASCGSSIGLSIVDKEKDLRQAIAAAFNFDSRVIIEEYIAGREMTVGILQDAALPVIEIVPKRRFFDYQAKYQNGLTEYKVPAQLEEDAAGKIRQAALTAHRSLDCFGCSRVDIILGKGGLSYVLEVNTIPGFTSTSLLPKAARCLGIEFGELCIKLIELAYAKAKV
jgi:D-alanine-D-alanine ligase